jgi:hypothetical protein
MGMRGLLGLLRRDGTVRYMYVQWGGELESMARVLKAVTCVKDVRALLHVNSASAIDHRTLTATDRHRGAPVTIDASLDDFMGRAADIMLEGVYCFVPVYANEAKAEDESIEGRPAEDDGGGALPGDDLLAGEWMVATRHPFALRSVGADLVVCE